MTSLASLLCERLVRRLGKQGAHRAIDDMLDGMQVIDVAALAYDWCYLWARPKQVPPATNWRSWGFLTGRGFGKSRSMAEFVQGEVEEGRARSIGMCGQNETKTAELAQVLIDTAPPWCKPVHLVTDGQLLWPNGAKAFLRTPEAPDAIRSENHDLSWLFELQSWPAKTREETWSNFQFATRIGRARTVWDATPKKRNPLLRKLLKRAEERPDLHIVVRGTMYENAANLGDGVVDELEREFGGTTQGREELLGEMLDGSDNALVKEAWIKRGCRPSRFVRKALGLDPAVTSRKGNDSTGMVLDALAEDGTVWVLANLSGKRSSAEWADLALDTYVQEEVEIIVAETNKAGDLVVENLRAAAARKRLRVVVIGKSERAPARVAGVVFVREVYARGAKDDRAQPLATAYERGRVVHDEDAALESLEDTLTTWEPGEGRSPDDLDAHVHAAKELMGLAHDVVDPKAGFIGVEKLAAKLRAPLSSGVGTAFRGGGGRI